MTPQALQLRVGVDVGSQCHRVAVGLSDGSLLEEFETPHTAAGFEDFFARSEGHATRHPYGVWKRVVKEVEQFQREEPASQLLPRDRAVALRRRNPEKTLAGLLDGSMGSAFVFIAPLAVSCSTGSAPASLRRR